ncbi:glycosyltransferase family A protein [Acinetobacter sp. XH1639]|uniref:glycosyltransferase family A protein n=1 Tax=Acinetobacter sp. XH1639 TaxID=3157368 RepID=UPI0032B5B7E0
MITTLYSIYSSTIGKKNNFNNKFIRFIIKHYLNFFIPIYYTLTKKQLSSKQGDFIVSLTTFPARIDKIWIVIDSILRQTLRPKKIILTLSELQFEGKKIPSRLIKLQEEKLLEVIWSSDDIRSHKKYLYSMLRYPDEIVVTIDDDFIYEKSMLENLYDHHQIYPDCVITHLALERNGANYSDWKNLLLKEVKPTYNIMQFGGSGVLYPAYSLYSDAFDKTKILELSPLADDLWLNAMAIINSTKIVKTNYKFYLLPLIFKNNKELYAKNVLEDKNNEQIKNIESYYGSILTNISFN